MCVLDTLELLCNAFCHDLFNTSAAPLYLVLPVGSSSLLSFAWLARGALGSWLGPWLSTHISMVFSALFASGVPTLAPGLTTGVASATFSMWGALWSH